VILRDSPAGGVWRLTLNRPAQRNALDAGLIAALRAELAQAAAAADCRVLLLAGSGSVFCAGADLAEMRQLAGEGEQQRSHEQAQALAGLLLEIHQSPKPVIALVQGAALGGGAGLAAASDIVLATTAARFAFPEVRLGLIPAVISPYIVAAMGARQAQRWCLSGEDLPAARAQLLGLVHECVAARELLPRALALAAAISLGGPQAVGDTKALLRAVVGQQPGAELTATTAAFLARTRAGPEARARLADWFGRR
jgi:methylglutaconyl-CoA hydratase